MSDIKIKYKVEELGKNIENLGKEVIKTIEQGIRSVSREVYDKAQQLAQQKLRTSTETYLNNLKYEQVSKNVYEIYIIPNSPAEKFEEGWDKYDMVPGFLKSSKAQIGKDGKTKYFDVPFQIKPDAKSPAGQKIMDMRSAVASVLKDKSVTKIVKKYNEGSEGMERFGDITRYMNTNNPMTEGLVRVKKPGQKQGKYFLFRRVSTNSPANKWQHPGFEGINIFENDLPRYAEEQINKMLWEILM